MVNQGMIDPPSLPFKINGHRINKLYKPKDEQSKVNHQMSGKKPIRSTPGLAIKKRALSRSAPLITLLSPCRAKQRERKSGVEKRGSDVPICGPFSKEKKQGHTYSKQRDSSFTHLANGQRRICAQKTMTTTE